MLGFLAENYRETACIKARQGFKLRGARAPVQEIRAGYRNGVVEARSGACNGDELLRMNIGQRLQKHAIDDAEDRGVRADAQRERHNGHQGKAGIFTQHARGVAQVLEEFIEPKRAPLVASNFANHRDVSEFAACGPGGVRESLTAVNTISRGHSQMALQFFIKLRLNLLAAPERESHGWSPSVATQSYER